jgi:bacteriorhodopsin
LPPQGAAGANHKPITRGANAREPSKEISMFLTLFVILMVMWLLGFFAFHVAGGLIHILLIVAVISLVAHLFMGRSAA